MEEDNLIQEESSILDFNKLLRIAWYRKNWSIACYVIIIISTILFTLVVDKQYKSEAVILINKASSTNLADINPYILAQLGDAKSGKGLASFLSSQGPVVKELEIMKSPLVLDKVIKENDIRYESGEKEGEFLTTEDFLEFRNVEFEEGEDSSIINISFESKSPELSRNVVKSIIKSFREVNTNINSSKATKDRKFLASQLKETEKELLKVSNEIKKFKQETGFIDTRYSLDLLSSANPFNKRVREQLSKFPELEQKGMELELKLDVLKAKYTNLKEKYEWASLVEMMSKSATDITILKKPRLKRDFEKSSPSLFKNIILAVVVSIIFSSIFVISLELYDPKLTFLSIKTTNVFWLEKNLNKDILNNFIFDIKERISLLASKNIGIVILNLNDKQVSWFNEVMKPLLEIIPSFKTYNYDGGNSASLYDFTEANDGIIILAKIGTSEKSIYNKLEESLIANEKLISAIIMA